MGAWQDAVRRGVARCPHGPCSYRQVSAAFPVALREVDLGGEETFPSAQYPFRGPRCTGLPHCAPSDVKFGTVVEFRAAGQFKGRMLLSVQRISGLRQEEAISRVETSSCDENVQRDQTETVFSVEVGEPAQTRSVSCLGIGEPGQAESVSCIEIGEPGQAESVP